jgi:hypothetical protein
MGINLFLFCCCTMFFTSCSVKEKDLYTLKRAWDYQNHPERMGLISGDYEVDLYSLPLSAQLSNVPWSGDYWPSYHGGISYRWNHTSTSDDDRVYYDLIDMNYIKDQDIKQLSPSEKFDILNFDHNYTLTNMERRRTNIISSRGIEDIPEWFGLCHAWAPATFLFSEPSPVMMTRADGKQVYFGSSDIKALLVHFLHKNPGRSYFVSRRCRVEDKKLKKQLSLGQITKEEYNDIMNSENCRGINPGSFHIILTNLIGLRDQGFVADVTRGGEVWNQSVFSYKSKIVKIYEGKLHENVAAETASEVKIETRMNYIAEIQHSWDAQNPQDRRYNTKQLVYKYWLELDKNGFIIGGSWSSKTRPDFLWNRETPKFGDNYALLGKIYKASILDVDVKSSTEDSISTSDLQWKVESRFYGYKVFVSGSVYGEFKDLQLQALDKNDKVVSSKDCDLENNSSIKEYFRIMKKKITSIALVAYDSEGNQKLFIRKEIKDLL